MNKKGVTFAVSIIIISLALFAYTLFASSQFSSQRFFEISAPINLVNVQSEAREAKFYIETSSELSSTQAMFNLLNDLPTLGNCSKLSSGEYVFSDECKLDSQLPIKFLEEFEKEFYSYLLEYESTFKTLPGYVVPLSEGFSGALNIQSQNNYDLLLDKTNLTAKSRENVKYAVSSAEYTVDFSFETKIPFELNEINDLYSKSEIAFNSCKNLEEITNCILEKVSSKYFLINVEEKGSGIYFNTKTTNKFYFNDEINKFDYLELKYVFFID